MFFYKEKRHYPRGVYILQYLVNQRLHESVKSLLSHKGISGGGRGGVEETLMEAGEEVGEEAVDLL